MEGLGSVPAKISQSTSPKPDLKPDPGPKAVLDSLKDRLRWLAEKAAALPGILGPINSWIFRVAANVVGFLAENLWVLLNAVAGLIISVVNKYDQKRGGRIRAKKH